MNFIGHAHLAADLEKGTTEFVLGSMLPDLAGMVGARLGPIDAPEVAAGVAFHHRSDAVFHAAPTFQRWNRDGLAWLRDAGVSRGAALATAHVGAELILDGWILDQHGLPTGVAEAFTRAASAEDRIRWRPGPRPVGLAEVCERLPLDELQRDYRSPAGVALRLERILARRPRLALAASERPQIEAWCARLKERCITDAAALIEEVSTGLLSYADAPRRSG